MAIEIINTDGVDDKFIWNEINDVEQEKHRKVRKAEFILQDDGITVLERFWWVPVNFERIRRITGYLVGTTDRWNDAKRAEEHDRVKHL